MLRDDCLGKLERQLHYRCNLSHTNILDMIQGRTIIGPHSHTQALRKTAMQRRQGMPFSSVMT